MDALDSINKVGTELIRELREVQTNRKATKHQRAKVDLQVLDYLTEASNVYMRYVFLHPEDFQGSPPCITTEQYLVHKLSQFLDPEEEAKERAARASGSNWGVSLNNGVEYKSLSRKFAKATLSSSSDGRGDPSSARRGRFADSFLQQQKLWHHLIYPIIELYKGRLSQSLRSTYHLPADEYQFDLMRLKTIATHVMSIYRNLILSVTKEIGSVSIIDSQVLPILNMKSENTKPPPESERITNAIVKTIHLALCSLADLSRYKRVYDQAATSPTSDKHAIIYCKLAIRLLPSACRPFNALGYISYKRNDLFNSFYWYVLSKCCSDGAEQQEPEHSKNLDRVCQRISQSRNNELLESPINDLGEEFSLYRQYLIVFMRQICALYYYHLQHPSADKVAHVKRGNEKILAELKEFLVSSETFPFAHFSRTLVIIAGLILVAGQSGSNSTPSEYDLRKDAIEDFYFLFISILETLSHSAASSLYSGPYLSSLRIGFDWLNKFAVRHPAQNRPSFAYLKSRLETEFGGLEFDPETAVGCRNLSFLQEEVICYGLAAFDGGLSDRPSGLNVDVSLDMEQKVIDSFRAQCVLFSIIELERSQATSSFSPQAASNSEPAPIDFSSGQSAATSNGAASDDSNLAEDLADEIVFKPRSVRRHTRKAGRY